jgi:hypothetical protein
LEAKEVTSAKKGLRDRIHGWFPNEPNMPNNQMKVTNKKNKLSAVSVWNPLWMAPIAVTLVFVAINYFLFQYPLSSVLTVAAITAVAVVLSIVRKQKNRLKIVDLGWFPKEPGLAGNRIKAAKTGPPKVVRVAIMVGILALMTVAAVTFLVPFMAESFLNRTIVWMVRILAVTMLVAALVYYKRRGHRGRLGREDSVTGEILKRALIGWRVRAIYPIGFGLATGFMLSAAVVLILGQPLPRIYSLPLFFVFCGVGAVIGEWIGKKVDYRWPIWAQKDWEADEK